MAHFQTVIGALALVARPPKPGADADRYLQLTPNGEIVWVEDPEAATAFPSMREATRTALRLPGGLRAFGLPRQPEMDLRRFH